jgi:hypothetical protein
MSVIKFELKEEHIKLIKHIVFEKESLLSKQIKTPHDSTPWGGIDYYEDMGIILYGKPEDFDPLDGNPFGWSRQQKDEMESLFDEMGLAIEIVLNTQKFEPGYYKKRYHLPDWKRYK